MICYAERKWFFEEAYLLCRDSDSNVSRIADCLYQQMLLQNQNSELSPLAGFNLLYFFQAVIQLWFAQRPGISLQSTKFPYPCEPIFGINWPQQTDIHHDVVKQFIGLVKSDSTPTGSDFDVDYSAKIIALVFDGNGCLKKMPSSIARANVEFDYWLSGFNAEPT